MRRWRKEAEAALRLEHGGHHNEAIARAEELVAKQPESATTLSIHASSSCQYVYASSRCIYRHTLEPSTTPQSSRLIMTRTMRSSASACRISGAADRFLSVPATADCEMESPI
ncbi:hypothetical protein GUJ93_ZPchr0010g8430 [Zizania palustris]|uniref:Uncharacterized protein n=1 Tax=Zizania palustris TaxID=103762 RepID=A0A8J5WGV9_ZIZPA|nr:hypothetical protein GUJ93_ZPchr0010g8430 [Zizania palustris]